MMKISILADRPVEKFLFAIAVILTAGWGLITGVVYSRTPDHNVLFKQPEQQKQAQKQQLSEQWGIELTAMRITAAGHMVDFRYRVTDAEKAAPLFKRQTKPYLLHQASGQSLAVPQTAKLGALRNSNSPQSGRVYWMFFGNHHRLINKGDKVTVVIGEFQMADIEVE